MSTALSIDSRDHATPELQAMINRLSPRFAGQAVAAAVELLVQDHLRQLNSERPNALGGRRKNFYAGAARGTTSQVSTDGTVTVSVNQQGIRQRYFGGTITPKNREWLTIPARSETYGRTAREFDNLRFVAFSGGSAALIQDTVTETVESLDADSGAVTTGKRRKKSRSEGMVMFWLVKSVTQPADPTVLPTREQLMAAAIGGLRDYAASFRTGTGGER